MKTFFQEFKTFISKGNVLDMAIGIIMGTAFKAIVDSVVADLLLPITGMLIGGIDLSALAFEVGNVSLAYGKLLQSILNFVIVAFFLFLMVKSMNRLKQKEKEAEEKPAPVEPQKSDEVLLLEEIRNLLASKKE